MNINNKIVVSKMKDFILDRMQEKEIIRYFTDFPCELDHNIYTYGNLDIWDNEIVNRLNEFGVINKALTEWNSTEPFKPINYSLREKIRSLYMRLVRLATKNIIIGIARKGEF